jgi:hypothetical protein
MTHIVYRIRKNGLVIGSFPLVMGLLFAFNSQMTRSFQRNEYENAAVVGGI